jgi:hypothetical protein
VVEIPRHRAASGWVNQTAVESSLGAIANVERFVGAKPSALDKNSWRTEIRVSTCLESRTKQATTAADESPFVAADNLEAASALFLLSSFGLSG